MLSHTKVLGQYWEHMLGYDSICINGRKFKLISCNEVVRFWYWGILTIKLKALVKHTTKNLKLIISSTALHIANRFFYISFPYGRVQLLYFHLLEKVLPWMKRLSSSCLEERLHKSVRVECTHLSGLLFAYGPAQLSWPPFPFLSDFSVYSSRSCVIFRHDHLLSLSAFPSKCPVYLRSFRSLWRIGSHFTHWKRGSKHLHLRGVDLQSDTVTHKLSEVML